MANRLVEFSVSMSGSCLLSISDELNKEVEELYQSDQYDEAHSKLEPFVKAQIEKELSNNIAFIDEVTLEEGNIMQPTGD